MWTGSIANVLLQSGSTVPEWISKLPKPSKMKRKLMGKVERGETVTKDGRIGRNEAVKKRYGEKYLLFRLLSLLHVS